VAEAYGSFVDAEFTSSVSSSQEISRRALTVVSTSGGLATLMATAIGFAAVNRKDAFFPSSARAPLVTAIIFFIIAAVVALLAQLPLLVRFIDAKSLQSLVTEAWDDSEHDAAQQVAFTRTQMLATERKMNTVRSWLLIGAIVFEIVAVASTGLMAGRVVDELTSEPTAAGSIDQTSGSVGAQGCEPSPCRSSLVSSSARR
jgi:hypothetical protein